MATLVFSSDTLDQGRIKINSFYTITLGTWTAGTGSNSLMVNNNTGNIASSSFCMTAGKSGQTTSAYAVVLGGFYNRATNNRATVINGGNNIAKGNSSTIVNGSGNTVETLGLRSVIVNGKSNYVNFSYGFIGNGSYNRIQTGSRSTIVNGLRNRSYANYSFVGSGLRNSAITEYCTVVNGINNQAKTGQFATVLNGHHNVATGYYGVVCNGSNNTVSGVEASVINGFQNRATAPCSLVLGGTNNTADLDYSSVVGKSGKPRFNGDFVFAYGSGVASVANNVARINSSGKGYFNGGTVSTGADYAELFEWDDQNINNENRKGYFVSLNGEKIKIGNENIIGVISVNPAVLGDESSSHWKNMYEKNIWDEIIYENFDVYKNTKTKNKIYLNLTINKYFYELPNPTHPYGIEFVGSLNNYIYDSTIKSAKFNNKFDKNQEYIPRIERTEWSAVGLMGKLKVRTSEIIESKFVDVDTNGMAINGNKYPVLNIIKQKTENQYGIVQILFK